MKSRAPAVVLAVNLCLLARLLAQSAPQPNSGAGAASAPPPQIYGKIEGEYYTSPTGLYKVRIPVLPQLGGSISDTPNVVTFEDDFNTHISIGAFQLSRELKWEYDTRGAKDFLVYFFTNLVMPDFAARFPGATMEDNAAFLPKFQDGSLLIFSLLPGGSIFAQRVMMGAAPTPLIAKRGNLCFVKYNYVFVISTELPERVLEHSTYHKTTEEENTTLRERLMAIVGKMQFTPPAEVKN